MSTTYQGIINKVALVLQDEDTEQTTRRWKESELLMWAKDAELEIAKLKTDSYPVVEVVSLSAGSQQSLPTRAVMLLDVLSNFSTDGTTRGDVITVVERSLMNTLNPGWMSDAFNTVVKHVIYDTKRAPKLYWVYPQSNGGNYIELLTAKLPDNDSNVIGDNILMEDEYANSMLHYILAMSFAKDFDIPQSAARTAAHMNIFFESLGRKEAAEEIYGPKRTKDTS
jgi:hypothetical protein